MGLEKEVKGEATCLGFTANATQRQTSNARSRRPRCAGHSGFTVTHTVLGLLASTAGGDSPRATARGVTGLLMRGERQGEAQEDAQGQGPERETDVTTN